MPWNTLFEELLSQRSHICPESLEYILNLSSFLPGKESASRSALNLLYDALSARAQQADSGQQDVRRRKKSEY